MYFPDFKKTNESSNSLSHINLDDSSSSGLVQMYLEHYKRFENKNQKK
jgi:hypothetical protein